MELNPGMQPDAASRRRPYAGLQPEGIDPGARETVRPPGPRLCAPAVPLGGQGMGYLDTALRQFQRDSATNAKGAAGSWAVALLFGPRYTNKLKDARFGAVEVACDEPTKRSGCRRETAYLCMIRQQCSVGVRLEGLRERHPDRAGRLDILQHHSSRRIPFPRHAHDANRKAKCSASNVVSATLAHRTALRFVAHDHRIDLGPIHRIANDRERPILIDRKHERFLEHGH